MAAVQLAEAGVVDDEKETKRNIVAIVKKVAEELGNTPAVCRASYIHPFVLSCYGKGITIDEFRRGGHRRIKRLQSELEPEEKALLQLFENR